jgi:RND superfamily putative drug exporter
VLATIPSTRSLGAACAIGVLVAVVAALGLLPATLALFGRGIFWPVRPRVGHPKDHSTGYFGRLGRGVRRRPTLAATLSVIVLVALSIGVATMTLGLSQSQSFRNTPESVRGQATLARAFPAGTSAPVAVIVATDSVDEALTAIQSVPGVVPASYETIRALRTSLAAHPSTEALVGGPVAESLDSSDAWSRDRALLIPLVLLVIFVVLVIVLRALVAPVLLIVTVVLSYFAALGASQFLFTYLYGYPAVDVGVPLISFIFLAALGVDYNIFLISRVLEERQRVSTSEAMVRSLAVTGVVITSAGVLLASVFAVLGVLPLITLTQVGVIVGIGVLLDTLLVRTVLVPALCFLTKERFWWPRHLPPVEDDAVVLTTTTTSPQT